MEPPTKKLRPYVTKWERKKAEENALKTNSTSSQPETNIKDLFINDETVLQFQDKYYKSNLPRKVWKTLNTSKECVWSVKWCNKFSHLLAATCENYLKLYDVMKFEKIKCVHSIKHTNRVRDLDWSRTSRQLVTCTFNGNIEMFDFLLNGKSAHKFNVNEQLSVLRWWPQDDNVFIIGGENSFLASYDIRSGKEEVRYNFKCGKILSLDFFSGGNSFMSSGDLVNRQSAEHNLIVWDTRMGAKLSSQIFHERYTCPCIRAHPSGTALLAQTTGNYIARFSAQKPFRLDKFIRYQNHTVNEYSVSFDISRDGNFVISGSSNGSIVCYKTNNGNYMRTVPHLTSGEDSACIALQCHPLLPSMVAVSDWGGAVHILT